MYGLQQASRITNNQLISHMEPQAYYRIPFKTRQWNHKTRRTIVFLYVDDFGVKHFNKYDADHLLESLKKYYVISTNLEGHNYL